MKNYKELTDAEKKTLIIKLYEQERKSFQDIAKDLGTYANKVRRDAIKYNINIRNKSEAQKNALNIGKHTHPTKGKKRSEATKNKIGKSVLMSWDNMSEAEINVRREKARINWENLSQDEKKYRQQQANMAVRKSSKSGSKLENFILERLIGSGYKVNFHQEQTLSNTKLQIDLFIPSMNTAIEVDGPSHFLPVWGEGVLSKNKKYDDKKEGLILGKGLVLIRIKQTKDFSKSRSEIIFEKLLTILQNIKTEFPKTGERLFKIED
jgi:very-short-patch-repair endonuclease